jgi:hypothetical protein
LGWWWWAKERVKVVQPICDLIELVLLFFRKVKANEVNNWLVEMCEWECECEERIIPQKTRNIDEWQCIPTDLQSPRWSLLLFRVWLNGDQFQLLKVSQTWRGDHCWMCKIIATFKKNTMTSKQN